LVLARYGWLAIAAMGCGGPAAAVRAGEGATSREGAFVEPIAAAPTPSRAATDGAGIIGLARSVDRQTAQRIAADWVEGVLSQDEHKLRALAAEGTASGSADREALVKQWLARGRYQRGRSSGDAFDPETVKIVEQDPEAAQRGAVAVTFEVKFEAAPMMRSYVPRPVLSIVRLLLVHAADGSMRIAASRE
jgi:hypothetical protein